MIKFPYGLSNFYRIQTGNYFYVDRTSHIRLIEDYGDQLIFLRPRRFGKSLLLSMLANYYDVAKSDEFERLFGHLAIGKNPTPEHNQYLVMTWNFSKVKAQGDSTTIENALYDHVNNAIKDFAIYYRRWLKYEIEIKPENAISSFESLLSAVKHSGYRLYLLIDEYDNFANDLMIKHHKESPSRYETLLSGEGIVKTLFKAVKAGAEGFGLERVFITGVSPMVLSDMSSGYNVGEHIYLLPEFNDLCGFLEPEMTSALTQIAKKCDFSEEKAQSALETMRTFYDGYRFSQMSQEFVYNPTLALYFLKHWQRYCQFPSPLLDSNLTMDMGKLNYISDLPDGEHVIIQALNKKSPLIIEQLANDFSIQKMLNAPKDMIFIISLLYFFGILTLASKNDGKNLSFQIPNLVTRKLYVEQLKALMLPEVAQQNQLRTVVKPFYKTGDLQPLVDFIETHYLKTFDNRDYSQANELTIKTIFLTLLSDETYYQVDSETELERRYADLTLIVHPELEQQEPPLQNFLLEFKYLKLDKAGLTSETARAMTREEVKALPQIQHKLTQGKKQLLDYEKRLKNKYQHVEQIQTICVVALGFEWIVWERVNG